MGRAYIPTKMRLLFRSSIPKLFGHKRPRLYKNPKRLRQRLRKHRPLPSRPNDEKEYEEGDEVSEHDEEKNAEDIFQSCTGSCMPITRGLAVNKTLLEALEEGFRIHGIARWMQSIAGGNKSEEDVCRIIRTTTKSLVAINDIALGMEDNQPVPDLDVVQFFVHVVTTPMLTRAVLMFLENYPWRPGTMLRHGYDILDVSRWLAMQPEAVTTPGFVTGIDRFQRMYANALKGAKKSLRRERMHKDVSIEKQVEERKYPPGGIQELQHNAKEEYETLLALFNSEPGQPPPIRKELYNRFMQLFFVLMWLSGPQGRVGGVASLRVKHAAALRQHGHVLTREGTKTYGPRKRQAVVLTAKTACMFDIYMQILRPAVAHSAASNDPLWLTFDGTPQRRIHVLVKAYYANRMGLDIGTTRLRGMVETDTHQRLAAGLITPQQRNSVSTISGHSVATAEAWYVKKNYEVEVARAREAFSDGGTAEELDFTVEPQELQALQWGRDHPSPLDASKAIWSPAEAQYLLACADEVLADTGGHCQNLMAAVRKRIVADFETTGPIFHHRHIFNTSRLRDGYRRLRGDRAN